MRSTIHFLVQTNFWVAICVYSLCLSTELLLQVSNCWVSLFGFSSTLFAYCFLNLIHHKKLDFQTRKKSLAHNKNLIYALLFFSALISLYCCFNFCLETLVIIFFIAVFSALYPFGLREVPRLKIYIISLIWSISTVILLAVENQVLFNWNLLAIFFGRFCFVFAITIPFDVRDVDRDNKELLTIPQLIGIKKSKLLSVLILMFFELIVIWQYLNEYIFLYQLLSVIFSCFVATFFIAKTTLDKSRFYYSFWIEGLSFLLFIGLLIANVFRY